MSTTFTKEKIQQLSKYIDSAKSIVITAHKSPDGDSIGSSLGMYHYLKKLGKHVTVCHPDIAPSFLHWMDGIADILTLESHADQVKKLLQESDLIFCLDYNHPSRTGKMEELLVAAQGSKIIVDHHRDPDTNFCTLLFSDITICSTCQMVFELIEASGNSRLIDEKIGTQIYTGIVTDTGSFRFASTTDRTHEIVAELLKIGVKNWLVHENLFDSNSLNKLKMVSYALLEKLVIIKEFNIAYVWLTQEEEKRFEIVKGDTEGLVNQILGIDGIKMSAFFKESDHIIKISFRSKGAIPVNTLANQHFEGGGHLNAAGGKYVGNIQDAIQKFVTNLPNFVEVNKALFDE